MTKIDDLMGFYQRIASVLVSLSSNTNYSRIFQFSFTHVYVGMFKDICPLRHSTRLFVLILNELYSLSVALVQWWGRWSRSHKHMGSNGDFAKMVIISCSDLLGTSATARNCWKGITEPLHTNESLQLLATHDTCSKKASSNIQAKN